jgi:hypothetical protein
MSDMLGPVNKVIVGDGVKGTIPYFQLPSSQKPQPQSSGPVIRSAPVITNGDQGAGQ